VTGPAINQSFSPVLDGEREGKLVGVNVELVGGFVTPGFVGVLVASTKQFGKTTTLTNAVFRLDKVNMLVQINGVCNPEFTVITLVVGHDVCIFITTGKVGATDGIRLGECDGVFEGAREGLLVVGVLDGDFDGEWEGLWGVLLGLLDGALDGDLDGVLDGDLDGALDGALDGDLDGALDGVLDGE
jgi:hypothetical protein